MSRTIRKFRLWLERLQAWRHLALMVAILVMMTSLPSLVHLTVLGRLIGDAFFAAVAVALFMSVFERRWERRLALALLLPALASNFMYYSLAGNLQTAAVITYHCSAVAFLGFAVVVILRGVFRRETPRVDDIIGAACGYLLASIAWANVYALVHAIAPGSFHVPGEIAWQLDDWHTRRVLFEYFSVASLTGLGYGDITPKSPPVYMLVGLEVVFGLFYLAVVVAQLVGLMMIRRSSK